MPKITRFTVDPYGTTLYFTRSRKAFDKLRARYNKDGATFEDALGVCSDFDGSRIILIGVFDGTADTLAHEVGHAVIKILSSCGVPINPKNSEAFCYLLGHWVGKLERLNK